MSVIRSKLADAGGGSEPLPRGPLLHGSPEATDFDVAVTRLRQLSRGKVQVAIHALSSDEKVDDLPSAGYRVDEITSGHFVAITSDGYHMVSGRTGDGFDGVAGWEPETASDDPLLDSIRTAGEEEVPALTDAWNAQNSAERPLPSFFLARPLSTGVIIINEEGRMEHVELNPLNVRDFLKRVKNSYHTDGYSAYEVRRHCLSVCEQLCTHEVYTIGDLPEGREDMKQELRDPNTWIPARRAYQELVARHMAAFVEAQAARSRPVVEEFGERMVLMLRGNTGAGKTTLVTSQSAPLLRQLDVVPFGSINPDYFKKVIQRLDSPAHAPLVNDQVHTEGAMLARRYVETAIRQKLPLIVIDRRFEHVSDVAEVLSVAREELYKVVMIDVHAGVQTCIDRVHGNAERGISGRDPNGPDPVVRKEEIRYGHRNSVTNRPAILDMVDQYHLYQTDQGAGAVLVAQKDEAGLSVHDDRLFTEATKDMRRETFVTQMEQNLQMMSRTAKGVVDTSATAVKASSMVEGRSGEETAAQAKANFAEALNRLFDARRRDFASPAELEMFVNEIATLINGGILKGGILLRRADSKKYPYTPIAEFERVIPEFYREFHERLSRPCVDPVEFAAWLEFKVNIIDHFFEDGCGKISMALSAWALARSEMTPPAYRSRDEYFATASELNRTATDSEELRAQQYQKWLAYYRTLHHGNLL